MNRVKKFFVVIAIVTGALFGGCTDDAVIEPGNTDRKDVEVYAATSSFLEVNPLSTRRVLPDGYEPYVELDPTTLPVNATIGLIFTQGSATVGGIQEVEMNKYTRVWGGTLTFNANANYYIYGFMPKSEAERAVITPYVGSDFATGAVMTINHLSTLTTADVCAIVGVKNGTADDDIHIADTHLGEFGFHGTASSDPGANKMYLLLKHLYAGLHFKCHLDAEYAKLRTIKVKKMVLKTAEKISEFINLSVTLKANDDNEDPVEALTYTSVDVDEEDMVVAEKQLFPREGMAETEFEVPVESSEAFLGCFAPQKCNGGFELTTEYDVYDKKGNLIREGCKATNKLDARTLRGITLVRAGEIYTIDLLIQPTYLYVLSEPDLDNPTISIQ